MKLRVLGISAAAVFAALAWPLSAQDMKGMSHDHSSMGSMDHGDHGKDAKAAGKGFVPGLGDIMAQQQVRHAKLWAAGSAGNWPLAGYEVAELKDGFNLAMTLHPTHAGMETAPLIRAFVLPRLADLEETIKAGRAAEFSERFDRLSAGCNECHKGLQHPFIVIQRPTTPPFTNQSFAPAKF